MSTSDTGSSSIAESAAAEFAQREYYEYLERQANIPDSEDGSVRAPTLTSDQFFALFYPRVSTNISPASTPKTSNTPHNADTIASFATPPSLPAAVHAYNEYLRDPNKSGRTLSRNDFLIHCGLQGSTRPAAVPGNEATDVIPRSPSKGKSNQSTSGIPKLTILVNTATREAMMTASMTDAVRRASGDDKTNIGTILSRLSRAQERGIGIEVKTGDTIFEIKVYIPGDYIPGDAEDDEWHPIGNEEDVSGLRWLTNKWKGPNWGPEYDASIARGVQDD